MNKYSSLLEIAKQSTLIAGKYLLDGFRTNPSLTLPVGETSRGALFSKYDKGSNKILTEFLSSNLINTVSVDQVFTYSEESKFTCAKKDKTGTLIFTTSEISNSIPQNSFTWIIDPICGSIPFSRGIPDFIISVALMHGKKLILGVVYDPVHKEQFYALRHHGSFLNGNIISPSATKKLDESYISIEHRVFRVVPPADIQKISQIIRRLRVAGTCGLEMAYVACGRIDGLIKLNQPLYDYAAGSIILEESKPKNKVISLLDGVTPFPSKLDTKSKFSFIASNGKIHSQLAAHTKNWPEKISA